MGRLVDFQPDDPNTGLMSYIKLIQQEKMAQSYSTELYFQFLPYSNVMWCGVQCHVMSCKLYQTIQMKCEFTHHSCDGLIA